MTVPAHAPQSAIQTAPIAGASHPSSMKGASAPGASLSQATLTTSRWMTIMGLLWCVAVVTALVCLQFGAERIGFGKILSLLLSGDSGVRTEERGGDVAATILLHVRLPRVLLGFLVGGCLAAVGVALQALLRNPLADPYVLGVSSGAALGAAIGILFGVGATFLAETALPICGFVGGLAALLVLYRMAVSYERLPIHSLLLAGVILNAIFSALVMFITSILDPNRSYGMMAWLMGTLTAPTYGGLLVVAGYLLVGVGLLMRQAHTLNLLALGEASAKSLGADTERAKRHVFVLAALMTGAIVSVSGMIGFIGMVVPHAVRLVLGADHRLLLPASALVGGAFLMGADTVARTLLAPAEIPVGIITALVGGPFFVYLLLWRKDRLA